MDSRIRNNEIKISIIMPVYNTERYAVRCIESVLRQTYQNIELIIVDDGSPGNVKVMGKKYMEADNRVRMVSHEKNMGLFRARMTGARYATGEYIAFIDSDDYVTNDYYHTLLEAAEKSAADISIGHTVCQREDGYQYIYNFHDACFEFDKIEDEEVQHRFFGQKGQCYSWHTVWNKLYRKSLWNQCVPYYEHMKGHVVMTEDIAFSTVLFYFAKSVTTVPNDAYFYCANENASTNAEELPFSRFKKNMQDIQTVFDFGESFLQEVRAEKWIQEEYHEFRRLYARIWSHLPKHQYRGKERIESLEILARFCPDENRELLPEDTFFASVTTAWRGGLEGFKEKIADSESAYISFDIFDTLIKRPFYEPTDLFQLMNKEFEKLIPSNIEFSKIRIAAEEYTRKKYGNIHPEWQDVALDEIYSGMKELYHFPQNVTGRLQQMEEELELRFCSVRNAGKELYEAAILSGKKVIIISDMYLNKSIVKQILYKNGYREYEGLFLSSELRLTKNTGEIYGYVKKDLHLLQGEEIYHIGDTWKNDYEHAKKAGFIPLFLPKAKEVFENRIHGLNTNDCSRMAEFAAGITVKTGECYKSIGYGCMVAMVYNRYFDNPFRSFHPESDFNIDPNFVGYYVVGMHLSGLSEWIKQQCRVKEIDTVHFLARDGYLPMKAYQIWTKNEKAASKANYIYASRKAVMSGMIKSKWDFYNLPVEYRNHSPKTLLSILQFASAEMDENKKKQICKKNNLIYDKPFAKREDYIRLLNVFLKEIYNDSVFQKNRLLAQEYYSIIQEHDIAFDMGYSGRIQTAISDLAGKSVDVLFVHKEAGMADKMKRLGKYQILTYYDYTPYVSGLLREHLLSDYGPGCVGFVKKGETVMPELENEEKHMQDIFVIETIQKAALQFISEFKEMFQGFFDYLPFRVTEVSLPFEGYLRNSRYIDRKIFVASYFEDMVYGACNQIKIEEFINNTVPYMEKKEYMMQGLTVPKFLQMLEGKSRVTKAVVCFLADKELFKHIVWMKYRNHKVLYGFGKTFGKVYDMLFVRKKQ